jgi:RND family efflux transporter MFP subunit
MKKYLISLSMSLMVLVSMPLFFDTLSTWAQEEEGRKIVTAEAARKIVTLTGFTRSKAEMTLVSEVAGKCVEVKADVGDPIGPQGIFARLDTTFIALDIEANKKRQEQKLSRINYLKKDLERNRNLAKDEIVPQSKLDQINEELEQERLQLSELKTKEKILNEQLKRYVIKAPLRWKVIERFVEPGEWVNVGTPLARLGDFQVLVVPFALNADEFDYLEKEKNPLPLMFPGENKKVPATIFRINPAFDPQTRKIKFDLIVKEGLQKHRGGLLAELELQLPDPTGAVLVPKEAVLERHGESWLIRENDERVRVMVMGNGPKGQLRVTAPEIKPGDRFIKQ